MSEFKYACPVCGQHIKCDSSQAGTVMDCPTCFQKITVPQAPSDADQKFILTGSKVVDKPPITHIPTAFSLTPDKKFPGALAVVLILVFAGATAAVIYWATIIHPRHSQTAGGSQSAQGTNAVAVGNKPKPPAKPPLMAPPASDTNWMLALDTAPLPDSPAAGRIHGLDFIVGRATFQNGSLTLRTAAHSPSDLSAVINFSGAQAEDMAGHSINVTTNAEKAAQVSLHWKEEGSKVQKENFESGYAMRLEFGALANNHLSGKIYLCTPDDDKSYLVGSFRADARKPKPKADAQPKQQ